MKRLLLPATLAFSLAFSGPLMFAQQSQPADSNQQATPDAQQTSPNEPQTHQGQAPPREHHLNPTRETARLTRQLNLTPAQSTRVEPILANRDQKIGALRTQGLAPQDMHQQMHAIQQSTRQQLETVLTPEQMEQLRALHHGRRGAPNQPQ